MIGVFDDSTPVDFEPDELSRFAVVEGDAVVNVIMAPDGYTDPLGRELVPAPLGEGPEIGWTRDGDGWRNPNAEVPTDEA